MKDLGNGLALCTVCESQLKVKTLTAHVNGRKHREAVARFRQNAERLKAIAISAQKRPANAPDKEELERSGDQFGNEASKKGMEIKWKG
jgi:hypothetical protein